MKKYELIKSIKETFWNKVFAMILFALGCSTLAFSNDATAMLFISIVSIGLFFSKKNYIC